jgi:predicted outer membrane protein
MNSLASRLILVCTIVTLILVPLYAHHGNQFLSKAMEMNAAEVQLGEMAMSKSQNPRVKDFADMLVRDHKQAMDKIRELREARATGGGKRRAKNRVQEIKNARGPT